MYACMCACTVMLHVLTSFLPAHINIYIDKCGRFIKICFINIHSRYKKRTNLLNVSGTLLILFLKELLVICKIIICFSLNSYISFSWSYKKIKEKKKQETENNIFSDKNKVIYLSVSTFQAVFSS